MVIKQGLNDYQTRIQYFFLIDDQKYLILSKLSIIFNVFCVYLVSKLSILCQIDLEQI